MFINNWKNMCVVVNLGYVLMGKVLYMYKKKNGVK